MKPARNAVQTQQRRYLRPMANFMHENMHHNFLGRCRDGVVQNLEAHRPVPLRLGKSIEQVLQRLPALLAKLKERFDVVVRNLGKVGERMPSDAFDVTLLCGENVLHQIAEGFKAAIAIRPERNFQRLLAVLLEALMPVLPLPRGVGEEVVEIELHACGFCFMRIAIAALSKRLSFCENLPSRWEERRALEKFPPG